MSEELWYVKLADGDVRRVTLDQLDGAFQTGQIDERTMVLGADATEWVSLGDLLRGGDADGDEFAAPAGTRTEGAADETEADHRAPAYNQPGGYRYAPPVAAQASFAPPAATPYGDAPPQTVAGSLRPMSVDLGDDLDVEYPKRSKKPFAVAVLAIAAIAAGVGFAATRAHGSGDDIASVAAAAALVAPHDNAPAAPPLAPVAAAVPPAAVAPASAPLANAARADGSPLNPPFTMRFNEGQKHKLLAADKTRDPKAKARHAGGGVSHASSPKAKSTTFTTGGNKFDPLNSSI